MAFGKAAHNDVKKGVFHVLGVIRKLYFSGSDPKFINMGLLREIKRRKPARLLSDLDVPETVWKADFDIADRYQGFANEIMRIALLGIGGYGFLIKELLTSSNGLCQTLIRGNKIYVSMGAVSLGLSFILVLSHRFYSAVCLYYQLLIVRSLKRLENSQWSEEEKQTEQRFLKHTRDSQRYRAILSRRLLIGSAIFFGAGFLFVIVVFLRMLMFA